jgi:hypothetical protein
MSRRRSSRSDNTIVQEVNRLFKQGERVDTTTLLSLRNKYGDEELVEQIQVHFMERRNAIIRGAKKFAQAIRKKYANSDVPYHQLLEKARKHRKSQKLSEAEFAEFQRLYEQELAGTSPKYRQLLPVTNMMKLLGYINEAGSHGGSLNVSDKDYRSLQEILKTYSSSKALHAQVMLQSFQYQDCDVQALSGKFHPEHGHQPGNHIHPVVAALFLPKIETLENHFLHSNIAGIVDARYNKRPLTTKPDYELFYALVTDPNDIVCDNKSPMNDLLNRVNLQQHLWNSVLHLRNGQYFNVSFREFINVVDNCRLNKHDNPDLVYGRHDGTVIKRLVSAFSFRPTIVATVPVYQVYNHNPYHQNVRPTVTSVPMINLRIMANLNNNTPVELRGALQQHQLFMDGNTVVPRQTDLIYSKGVLFFYVDRRSYTMRLTNNEPFNLSRLPVAVSGFERINTRRVNFEPTLNLRNDRYKLRSVVCAELNRNDPSSNIVVGSSCLISGSSVETMDAYARYAPLDVTNASIQNGNVVQPNPIVEISYNEGMGPASTGASFVETAQTRGVIFMYQLVAENSDGTLQY